MFIWTTWVACSITWRTNDTDDVGKMPVAQLGAEYLGHISSKGSNVELVRKMPRRTDLSSLKSLLGSVLSYRKFIPNLATTVEWNKKEFPWKWWDEEQAAFEHLKMYPDNFLVNFQARKACKTAM